MLTSFAGFAISAKGTGAIVNFVNWQNGTLMRKIGRGSGVTMLRSGVVVGNAIET